MRRDTKNYGYILPGKSKKNRALLFGGYNKMRINFTALIPNC